ncbi:MAG: HDOD domain-containing protein [Dechloromonas sp.]|nr:HDOD domain-containing protein [Dechloromonas sp.]
MLTAHQMRWGVDQWAAYLSGQELPCMPRSKVMLAALEQVKGEFLSARELADIVSADPFLCLRLLREAEKRRTQRLGHETTTPLAAVMQLGVDGFRELLLSSPETDEDNLGLAACEARSHLAAQLALQWGSARSDISPEEVALATLLAEMGELLLWAFAPELPLAALEALESGRADRSAHAQEQVCGFVFKQLTLKCAVIWSLPSLVQQLIRGADNPRANLSRICVDTARHLAAGPESSALPSDLAAARKMIPGASLQWLAERMVGLDEARRGQVIEEAEEILRAEG